MSTSHQRNFARFRTELARQTEAVRREFPTHRPVEWERLIAETFSTCRNLGGWSGDDAFATAGREELHVGIACARLAEGDPRFPPAERATLPDFLRERAATFRTCLVFCRPPCGWSINYILRMLSKLEREDATMLREAVRLSNLDPTVVEG